MDTRMVINSRDQLVQNLYGRDVELNQGCRGIQKDAGLGVKGEGGQFGGWEDMGKGGMSSPCGFCDANDEFNRSDTPSSTCSSVSAMSEEEEEEQEYMKEVNAASQHLEMLTTQALKLLDDMEVEQKTLNILGRSNPHQDHRQRDRHHRPSQHMHKPSSRQPIQQQPKRRTINKLPGQYYNNSSSSRGSSSSTSLYATYPGYQRVQSSIVQRLQYESRDIMQSARQVLQSVQQDSYTERVQQKVRAALSYKNGSEQFVPRASQQTRMKKEQLIAMQQMYQEQRRQLRHARKSAKFARLRSSGGSLSPIPEVHSIYQE
eukprot:TRINITY_DN3859_c0_g1_i4.p1 TRINITY_DN3859_c0_g1~~TRINITY_DN3859_c0_g1_i4.p1  ORF type:complete len:317 (+),score=40.99 TRINITY_DN3859_c0_g1_i4:448-1398(+)